MPDSPQNELGAPASPPFTAPDWMTADDALLNIRGDLLGITVGYGGERIVAGSRMDSMLAEIVDYILSERAAALRERALSRTEPA